uniref:Putative secreted protein n=1 Tax=Anopheles triannulatus TaxID=58253 RepID=A0A2M4B3Z5_9DIPT
MRCARLSACASVLGFQSNSANSTKWAAVSVMPALHAFRESTAARQDSFVWNFSTRGARRSDRVDPSIRMKSTFCFVRNFSIASSMQ